MSNLRPGKGVHLSFEDGMAEWFNSTAESVSDVVTDYDEDSVIDELTGTHMFEHVSDKFGEKAYKAFKLENGNELRVTVVHTRNGLRLDVREWYEA